MPPARFEPAIPASERPHTYASDHADNGIALNGNWSTNLKPQQYTCVIDCYITNKTGRQETPKTLFKDQFETDCLQSGLSFWVFRSFIIASYLIVPQIRILIRFTCAVELWTVVLHTILLNCCVHLFCRIEFNVYFTLPNCNLQTFYTHILI